MHKRAQEQRKEMQSKRIKTSGSQYVDGNTNGVRQLPQELEAQVERIESLFHLDQKALKKITERFGEELEEGLQEHGKNIAMYVTWVLGFPSGNEKGQFLTLDLGGTNLRVCWITLHGRDGQTDVQQTEFTFPEHLKTGKAEALWDFIAESLESFVEKHKLEGTDEKPLLLGFTFSYPAIQDNIDHGVLQTWTKGFDVKGVEGEDVAKQLRDAIAKRKLPIQLVALVNDTTGAMIASAYKDSNTVIGAIFGTGCNAAYMEDCESIPKLQDSGLEPDTQIAINCEYGAFDNALRVLPRTTYDEKIDSESPRPGEQAFEKMSAGLYLGELFRLIVLELHDKGFIFEEQDLSALKEAYSVDTAFISQIEEDESISMSETEKEFEAKFKISSKAAELEALRKLSEIISIRGARLCACGVAAICKKKNISKGHIAADGSVANKNQRFRERWAAALGEILDWQEDRKEDSIVLTPAEDGSGIGAAIIAAMTIERQKKGDKNEDKGSQTSQQQR